MPSYADAVALAATTGASAVHRGPVPPVPVSSNTTGDSAWFDYTRGTTRHQVHFDDAESLRAKIAVAARLGLAGVGMWTANADYLNPLKPAHYELQRALFGSLVSTRRLTRSTTG